MNKNRKLVKFACYTGNISMSVAANISPILFITFHSTYNISYSLLGFLVLINFLTQLTIDLIFSFFSHKFNIKATVKTMPLLTVFGLIIYAMSPILFPNNIYVGLAIGTFIFSASSGLGEVLLTPVIAALPSNDPDREVSKLHSVYAWGVVFVVIFSTIFLTVFGTYYWQWLAIIFTVIPILSTIFFSISDIPNIQPPKKASNALQTLKNRTLWICVLAIFLGGAAECTMAQWASGYLEKALGLPKILGDTFGVALFALMMAIGRTLYSKSGKNIEKLLIIGSVGATVCYALTAISPFPILSLITCVLTGFCVSMMWPGTLIISSDLITDTSVIIYAMLAAGGDFGASVGPQLVGIIADFATRNKTALALANNLNLSPDQLGMKLGIIISAFFPLLAFFVFSKLYKLKKQNSK